MYKLSKGISFRNNSVKDERLDILYNNSVIYQLLSDISYQKINNLDIYLKTLKIGEKNRSIVNKYIEFCLKRNLINKRYSITNTSTWNKSRIKMTFIFFINMCVWILPIIPFMVINKYYNINMLAFIQFYVIHMFSVFFHEAMHSLFYWLFQKKCNGYFIIGFYNCSFVYNESFLSKCEGAFVAIIGSIMTIIALIQIYFIFNIFFSVLCVEIIIQLVSIILGADGVIFYQNIVKKT